VRVPVQVGYLYKPGDLVGPLRVSATAKYIAVAAMEDDDGGDHVVQIYDAVTR
jgi:hypothetical protein